MGTFYGGLAHVPLSSLIIVCELAGSYDLLVPLMLAEGIAFVALRHRTLYHAQLPTRRHSPAHQESSGLFAPLPGRRTGPVVAAVPIPPTPPPPPPIIADPVPALATAMAGSSAPPPPVPQATTNDPTEPPFASSANPTLGSDPVGPADGDDARDGGDRS